MTFEEFKRKFPEMRHLPEYIHGKDGKRIPLMDATLEDFRAYQRLLEGRIRREERRRRRGKENMRGGNRGTICR